MNNPPTHAVFDVGTNSVKLLVGSLVEGRVVGRLHRVRITRMGSGLGETGRLSDAGVHRTVAEMQALLLLAREWKPVRTFAVGLEAFRRASNGAEMACRISAETGVPVQVLSGLDEARLGREAVLQEWGEQAEGRLLTIDIGGASTELALTSPPWEVSLPVGVVTCGERFLGPDVIERGDLEMLAAEVESIVRSAWAGRKRGEPELRGMIVGGTATTFATIEMGLEGEDLAEVHGYEARLARVRDLRDRLAAMSSEERCRVPGLHPLRAPVVVAGLTLLEVIMGVCGLERATVSLVDLLHGVLRRIAEGNEGWQ